MTKLITCGLVLALSAAAIGCKSKSDTHATNGAAGTPTIVGNNGAGVPRPTTGSSAGGTAGTSVVSGAPGMAAAAGMTAAAGRAATTGSAGAAPATTAGTGGSATAGSTGGAAAAAPAGAAGTASPSEAGISSSITGTLGALGAVQPIMNGWATTNGPETLIYLTTAKLTCADMMTMGVRWLAKLPAKSQVLEIVVPGTPTVKSYTIGAPDRGEVNYAEGSKSSSTEVTGGAGAIAFTKIVSKMVYEGTITVSAPYTAKGTFHADWCQGGAEY